MEKPFFFKWPLHSRVSCSGVRGRLSLKFQWCSWRQGSRCIVRHSPCSGFLDQVPHHGDGESSRSWVPYNLCPRCSLQYISITENGLSGSGGFDSHFLRGDAFVLRCLCAVLSPFELMSLLWWGSRLGLKTTGSLPGLYRGRSGGLEERLGTGQWAASFIQAERLGLQEKDLRMGLPKPSFIHGDDNDANNNSNKIWLWCFQHYPFHHLIWSSQHCETDIIISILQMKKPALKSLMDLCMVAGRELWGNLLMPVKSEEKVKLLSHVLLFVTPWTIAHQAFLSMGILQTRILDWVAISFSAPLCPFPPWALNSNPKTVLFKKPPKQKLKTVRVIFAFPSLFHS